MNKKFVLVMAAAAMLSMSVVGCSSQSPAPAAESQVSVESQAADIEVETGADMQVDEIDPAADDAAMDEAESGDGWMDGTVVDDGETVAD